MCGFVFWLGIGGGLGWTLLSLMLLMWTRTVGCNLTLLICFSSLFRVFYRAFVFVFLAIASRGGWLAVGLRLTRPTQIAEKTDSECP
jgi:hypothetical protein